MEMGFRIWGIFLILMVVCLFQSHLLPSDARLLLGDTSTTIAGLNNDQNINGGTKHKEVTMLRELSSVVRAPTAERGLIITKRRRIRGSNRLDVLTPSISPAIGGMPHHHDHYENRDGGSIAVVSLPQNLFLATFFTLMFLLLC